MLHTTLKLEKKLKIKEKKKIKEIPTPQFVCIYRLFLYPVFPFVPRKQYIAPTLHFFSQREPFSLSHKVVRGI